MAAAAAQQGGKVWSDGQRERVVLYLVGFEDRGGVEVEESVSNRWSKRKSFG